jgi:Fe2+ transport system protein FeoA
MAAEPLAALPVGAKGRVVGIRLGGGNRQRLLEMGLTVGAGFEVVRQAPLGDPIDLKVRGYHLSIRRADAAEIDVERAV